MPLFFLRTRGRVVCSLGIALLKILAKSEDLIHIGLHLGLRQEAPVCRLIVPNRIPEAPSGATRSGFWNSRGRMVMIDVLQIDASTV